MKRRWRGEGSSSSRPLLLPADQVRAIARRSKTQLRRLAVDDMSDGSAGGYRPCGLDEGSTYRVQPVTDRQLRESDPVARVVVVGVELQALRQVTVEDALAEGHRSLRLFADSWLRRHDRGWPPLEPRLCSNCDGWAVFTDHEGELVECNLCDVGEVQGERPVSEVEVLERFVGSFGRRSAWVVTFRLDERRFLHRHSDRGYTSDPREALPGEPEVLPAPRREWRSNAEQLRRRDLADRDAVMLSGLSTVEDRIELLERLARERGVDVMSERAVIEQRIAAMARKVERRAAPRSEAA